jgi:hypothetical protein
MLNTLCQVFAEGGNKRLGNTYFVTATVYTYRALFITKHVM